MMKMEDSIIGRKILASFACANKLNKTNDQMQFPSSISDSELDNYLKEKDYNITYDVVNDNDEQKSLQDDMYEMLALCDED